MFSLGLTQIKSLLLVKVPSVSGRSAHPIHGSIQINGADNLGEKTNTAEISEDYNDHGDVPDRDSTPDNQVPGEDDIDIAKVILTISTGIGQTFFGLTIGLLSVVLVGVVLIKRFVL